ncbi:MAG: ribonuclease HII [Nitrospirae bacterium]|nr:ribonuclease HII [Nitrospirota bacterium]
MKDAPCIPCLYEFDKAIRREGFRIIAGVDEAGRGPLAGPVVAAAVILPDNLIINRIRDSKKVPAKEREELYNAISRSAIDIGVGIVSPEDIDRLNILNAAKLAMRHAIAALKVIPDIILIDAVRLSSIDIAQRAIVKGDGLSASIAAASIVAKTSRDRLMAEYHLTYPEYGFDRHKGYGTADHLERIRLYGPCPLHRMSFRGVKPFTTH